MTPIQGVKLVTLKPRNWLAKQIEEAKAEIKTWPKWMQDLSKEDMEKWEKSRD